MGIGFGIDVDGDGTNDLFAFKNGGGRKKHPSSGYIAPDHLVKVKRDLNVLGSSAVILNCKFCDQQSLQYDGKCCWCGENNSWRVVGKENEITCLRCENILVSDVCKICKKENPSLNFQVLLNPMDLWTLYEGAGNQAVSPIKAHLIFLVGFVGPIIAGYYYHINKDNIWSAPERFWGAIGFIVSILFYSALTGWVINNYHFKTQCEQAAKEWDGHKSPNIQDNSIDPSTSRSSFKEISQRSINSVKKPFSVIKKAVSGELDTEESIESTPSQNMQTDAIWIMKPNGQVGGPFTKEKLRQLKSQGKLPQGMKASRSKDGPWKEIPTG